MTRKPLSLEETTRVLAELRSKLDGEAIAKIIKDVKTGQPDEARTRALLAKFCRLAPGVRECMSEDNHTPTIIEFVADRLALFLSGIEPDLLRALGLKRQARGRKPKIEAKQRRIIIAAKVMMLLKEGRTLDVAAEIVAQDERIHENTARNFYTKNKQEASTLLAYQLLSSPREAREVTEK